MLHGRRDFSPGYFDLVIHDEAHRSIWIDARKRRMLSMRRSRHTLLGFSMILMRLLTRYQP
jgi:type I site-specific restriction endonuclease